MECVHVLVGEWSVHVLVSEWSERVLVGEWSVPIRVLFGERSVLYILYVPYLCLVNDIYCIIYRAVKIERKKS